MNRHLRRCPATTFRIEDKRIAETWRCQKPAGHDGAHENLDKAEYPRWTFGDGSYSGLTEDHPAYNEQVGQSV